MKSAKFTTTTWLIGMPTKAWIVLIASAGPPICIAALIFCVPLPGIGNLDVPRDRQVVDPVPGRVGAHQHDRVRVLVARASLGVGVVGSEQQNRRRASRRAGRVCGSSAAFAPGSSREFASDTPLENENQPSTAPDHDENEQQRDAERDPPAPVGGLRRDPGPVVRRPSPAGPERLRCRLRRRPAGRRATTAGPSSCRVGPGRRDRASRPPPSGGLGYPAIMSANRVIGVDLGGTKILAGLIDADGGMHETVERPTVTTSQDALLSRARRGGAVAAARGSVGGRIRHPVADRPRAWGRARRRGEYPAPGRSVPGGDAAAARPAGRAWRTTRPAPPTASTGSARAGERATS